MDFKFLDDCMKELEEKGYFTCSNKELATEIYQNLKPKHPLLYQWHDGVFDRLNLITDMKQARSLITQREELEAKIAEIDFILYHFAEKYMPDLLENEKEESNNTAINNKELEV